MEVAKLIESLHAAGHSRAKLARLRSGCFRRSRWIQRGRDPRSADCGPLGHLGLAEGYVATAVGGRDVGDATAFAKLATEEHAGLVERGGELRRKVQAADRRRGADPVARPSTAAGPTKPTPTPNDHGKHHGPGTTINNG